MSDELFEGHQPRECGEHRTVGPHRAWCFECHEWCYPDEPCSKCEAPALRADRDHWKARAETAEPVVEAAKAWRESERNGYWMLDPDLAATQKTALNALEAAVDALNRDNPNLYELSAVSDPCPVCGNATDSPYHRNVCQSARITTLGELA